MIELNIYFNFTVKRQKTLQNSTPPQKGFIAPPFKNNVVETGGKNNG